MPLIGYICPYDNKPISFKDCRERCRKFATFNDNHIALDALRCYPLPVLNAMARGNRPFIKPSTTQLCNDPHYEVLKITKDYYQSPHDLIFMIMGSANHFFLQRDATNQLQEQFLEDEICTGTIDLYDGDSQTLYDYKFLGVFKIKMMNLNFDSAEEYIKQANRYRSLLEANGFPVKDMVLVAFGRDWRRYEFVGEVAKVGKVDKMGKPYPPPVYPCQQYEIPKYDFDPWFISQKEKLLKVLDGSLKTTECESEFRWSMDKRCRDGFCAVHEFCEYYNNNYKE
jgi:hypothetical protein